MRTSDNLIGTSPAMTTIRSEVESAARSDAKVLLIGESGVGKEVVAHLVHQHSARGGTPLVTINCVSVPESLLESELFGHVRGSFTGAYRDRVGLLEVAHRGTVFLDEVCEMSPRMQGLLLRFLESGEIQRVGSERVQCLLDVRVIAATNREPVDLVNAKAFREDLYYRLNVISIRIPPLRARREDIPVLFDHFLRAYGRRHNIAPPQLDPAAMQRIIEHDWPGNVRQLKNVAERLIVRSRGPLTRLEDLPPEILGPPSSPAPTATGAAPPPAVSNRELLFERMVKERESFWSAVHPGFMRRDLTRDDVRFIVTRGLQETAGSYKMLVELLNMHPTDYKRFLSFLRKHECHVPFERFRTIASWRRIRQAEYADRMTRQ